jgi:hypothetical protein
VPDDRQSGVGRIQPALSQMGQASRPIAPNHSRTAALRAKAIMTIRTLLDRQSGPRHCSPNIGRQQMSNADQWPTALAVITAEWLPRQTARNALGKTDRRDWARRFCGRCATGPGGQRARNGAGSPRPAKMITKTAADCPTAISIACVHWISSGVYTRQRNSATSWRLSSFSR